MIPGSKIKHHLNNLSILEVSFTHFSILGLGGCLQNPTNPDISDAIIVVTGLLYRDLMGRDVAVLTKDEVIRNANPIRTIR
jgi:hypothetical protein